MFKMDLEAELELRFMTPVVFATRMGFGCELLVTCWSCLGIFDPPKKGDDFIRFIVQKSELNINDNEFCSILKFWGVAVAGPVWCVPLGSAYGGT